MLHSLLDSIELRLKIVMIGAAIVAALLGATLTATFWTLIFVGC